MFPDITTERMKEPRLYDPKEYLPRQKGTELVSPRYSIESLRLKGPAGRESRRVGECSRPTVTVLGTCRVWKGFSHRRALGRSVGFSVAVV